jgi:hypothetical protein
MVTLGNDANGDLLTFDPSIASEFTVESHDYSVVGGYSTGDFSALTWVTATESGFRSYLDPLYSSDIVDDILDDAMVQDVIANNITGTGVIGIQVTDSFDVPIPEPSTLLLFGVGALGFIAYGWRRWKSAERKT